MESQISTENRYFTLLRSFLKDELELNGKAMVKELVYRFAMVQFRDTRDFEPGKEEFIPKVLAEAQMEFGKLFEQFAKECFEQGQDIDYISKTVKKWLLKIMKEIIPAK
ncbi:MAG: hypothetical protein ACOX2F_11195 [bacterium]